MSSRPPGRTPIYQEQAGKSPAGMARLHEQYCMHALTADERVTCESMLLQVG